MGQTGQRLFCEMSRQGEYTEDGVRTLNVKRLEQVHVAVRVMRGTEEHSMTNMLPKFGNRLDA